MSLRTTVFWTAAIAILRQVGVWPSLGTSVRGVRERFGGNEWPRTIDLTLIMRLLCQLSYASMYAAAETLFCIISLLQ